MVPVLLLSLPPPEDSRVCKKVSRGTWARDSPTVSRARPCGAVTTAPTAVIVSGGRGMSAAGETEWGKHVSYLPSNAVPQNSSQHSSTYCLSGAHSCRRSRGWPDSLPVHTTALCLPHCPCGEGTAGLATEPGLGHQVLSSPSPSVTTVNIVFLEVVDGSWDPWIPAGDSEVISGPRQPL